MAKRRKPRWQNIRLFTHCQNPRPNQILVTLLKMTETNGVQDLLVSFRTPDGQVKTLTTSPEDLAGRAELVRCAQIALDDDMRDAHEIYPPEIESESNE